MAEMPQVNDDGTITDIDALRLDAHRLRELSRALAQKALEARQAAKDGRFDGPHLPRPAPRVLKGAMRH